MNARATVGPVVALMGGLLVVALALIPSPHVAVAHTCDPSGPDTDGDGLPDDCDPNRWDPDWDNDGFSDAQELYLGTPPFYRGCGWDSYPPDLDGNGQIAAGDVFAIFPKWMTTQDSPTWSPRYDINTNGAVGGMDVFVLFPIWLQRCDQSWHHNGIGLTPVTLHGETTNDDIMKHWAYDSATFSSGEPGVYRTLYCGEFEAAARHWRRNSAFDVWVSYSAYPYCDHPNAQVRWRIDYDASPWVVAGMIFWGDDDMHKCDKGSPCDVGREGLMWFSYRNDYVNSPAARHYVLTHEFGHIIGMENLACSTAPWSIMSHAIECLMDAGMHRVPTNERLFSLLKYSDLGW